MAHIPDRSDLLGASNSVLPRRVEALDVLRGIALLGMFLVHMVRTAADPVWLGDRLVAAGVHTLALGKFYPLFSLLFGIGFAIQMQRVEERGGSFVGFYLRRMGTLFLLALGIWVFADHNSILFQYAVLGAVLVPLRRIPARTLLLLGLAGILVSVAYSPLHVEWRRHMVTVRLEQKGELPSLERVASELQREDTELQRHNPNANGLTDHGTYWETALGRAEWLAYRVRTAGFYDNGEIFAMVVFGSVLGRAGVFRQIESRSPFIRQAMIWGLALGLPGSMLVFLGARWWDQTVLANHLLVSLLKHVSNPALMLFYASATLEGLRHPRWRRLVALAGWPGRMALTHFALHILFIAYLSYGYGFGLGGQIPATLCWAVGASGFALQIVISLWWLRAFHFGPLEWAWRSSTYLRLEPLRRQHLAGSISLAPPKKVGPSGGRAADTDWEDTNAAQAASARPRAL